MSTPNRSARGYAGEVLITGRGLGRLKIVEKSETLYYESTIYSKHFANKSKSQAKLVPLADKTRTEARKWHNDRNNEVSKKKSDDSDKSLRDVHEEWATHTEAKLKNEHRNTGTVSNARRNFKRHVEPYGIADLKLAKIDGPVALLFLRHVATLPIEYSTRENVIAAVRTPLRWARETGAMDQGYDPFRGLPRSEFPLSKKKREKLPTAKKKKTLDKAEIERLIRVLLDPSFDKPGYTVWANAVLVLLLEGDRTSETLGRRYRDVIEGNLSTEGQLAATREDKQVGTKNGLTSLNEMHPLTAKAILRQRQIERWQKGLGGPDNLIFTMADGKPMSRNGLWRAVVRAAKLAGLGHVNCRDLRRSFCTNISESKEIPPAEAAAITRHSLATWINDYVKPRETEAQRKRNGAAVRATGYGMLTEEAI